VVNIKSLPLCYNKREKIMKNSKHQQYILLTSQFGTELIICGEPLKTVTTEREEGMKYDERDNKADKIAYWEFQTGYTLQAINI